ncbi:MAG: geranylgeranyl reductase family protein, partial [Thermodesulfobacteriota bacterium]
IEKDRFPRYKPCGGFLSPRVLKELDFDIGRIIESTVSEAKFTFQLKDPFSIVSPNPIGYLVMRDSFDHLLCREAQERGADLYEGTRVVTVRQDAEGVDVSMEGGRPIRCRYLIGADGARGVVALLLNGGVMRKMGVALEGEGRLPAGIRKKWSSVHLDLGVIPNGYGWIFPKGSFVSFGIGVTLPSKGMKLRSRLERFIAGVDYIGEVEMEKVYSYPMPTFSGDDLLLSKGRVLLVGDAANLIDPLTGEGVYYAIKSGQIAAGAIVKAIKEDRKRVTEYGESLKRTLLVDLAAALRLSKAIYRFPRLAYTVFKSNRSLGLLYLHILTGNARYGNFSRGMIDGIRRHLRGKMTSMMEMSTAFE